MGASKKREANCQSAAPPTCESLCPCARSGSGQRVRSEREGGWQESTACDASFSSRASISPLSTASPPLHPQAQRRQAHTVSHLNYPPTLRPVYRSQKVKGTEKEQNRKKYARGRFSFFSLFAIIPILQHHYTGERHSLAVQSNLMSIRTNRILLQTHHDRHTTSLLLPLHTTRTSPHTADS